MAYELVIVEKAQLIIETLGKRDRPRHKKVLKVLALLEQDPSYRSLETHRYVDLDKVFGESIWQSNVEAGTPSAWRIWWFYGPDKEAITVVDLGPHP